MGSMPNIFGNVSPFMANPQVNTTIGGYQPLNPDYYATKQATDALAKYLGGTSGTYVGPSGGQGVSNPNTEYGVNVGGQMYNAGNLIADLQKWGPSQLYAHGYDPSVIAGINNVVAGAQPGASLQRPGTAAAGALFGAPQAVGAGGAGPVSAIGSGALPGYNTGPLMHPAWAQQLQQLLAGVGGGAGGAGPPSALGSGAFPGYGAPLTTQAVGAGGAGPPSLIGSGALPGYNPVATQVGAGAGVGMDASLANTQALRAQQAAAQAQQAVLTAGTGKDIIPWGHMRAPNGDIVPVPGGDPSQGIPWGMMRAPNGDIVPITGTGVGAGGPGPVSPLGSGALPGYNTGPAQYPAWLQQLGAQTVGAGGVGPAATLGSGALPGYGAPSAAGVPQATQANASGPAFTPTGGPSFNNSSQFFAPALANTPAAQAGGGTAGSGTGVNSIDQWMANFLGQGGQPTDQTQAWHSMIDAQQRGIKENFANLNEAFNVSGNRFSSSYGNAATDFWSQTSKDQNALLAQMTLASQEAARQRQMGLASQLSGQAFQGAELGQQQAFAGASQASQQAAQMAQMLSQLSAQGGQAMFGAENQAANALFSNAQSLLPFLANLNQQGAGNLSQLYNQSLQTGSQLGGQQYGTLQDQINRMYQQFYATQPQTNPMLQYLMSGATTNPQLMYPNFQSGGGVGSTLGGIGGLLGGLAAFLPLLLSDERVKERIEPVDGALDKLSRIKSVKFKYKGSAGRHVGVLAQDVEKEFPELVTEVDGVKMVNYMELSSVAIQAVNELRQRVEALEERRKQ